MKEAIRFTVVVLILVLIIIFTAMWPVYGFPIMGVLIFVFGMYDLFQKEHAVLRNFPVLGHMRFLLEMIAPELHQYFVESDTDGKPIDRNHRTYVYTRAKLGKETHPCGTELNVEAENYKWMQHSIYPSPMLKEAPLEIVCGNECKKPYSASIFNISAVSFGALNKNAVLALNLWAKAGNFFHDAGEGGISDYHLKGGDLVYEVGTGYFGCRTEGGNFSPEKFKEKTAIPAVKMI